MVAMFIAMLSTGMGGVKTIDDVPLLWRDEVRKELEKQNAKLD